MNDFYMPNSWYEVDAEPDEIISDREQELEQIIDNAADLLKEVVRCLYEEDKLSDSLLDGTIGELAWLLKVEVPSGLPTIERKNKTLTRIANFLGGK